MRVRLLSLIVVVVAAVCVARLAYIQVLNGAEFAEVANRQYAHSETAEFSRGNIYFKEKTGGRVSAATLKDTYFVAVNPALLMNAVEVYTRLKSNLTTDEQTFLARATKKDDTYEVIEKNIDQKNADNISALKIKGVTIYTEKKRYYPGGRLGSGFLGFVGLSKDTGDTVSGRAGLESYFDDILVRHAGGLYVNFFAEVFSNLSSAMSAGGNQLDGDIVTTVEPTVERQLEDTLATTEKTWHADQIGGIILDPMTGKIVAMAGYPDYDPNEFNAVKDPRAFQNPNVENMYEMGSTMKPLAMAAAIDSGVLTPDTMYTDTGSIILDKKKISNYDGKARGRIYMQEVLNQSLNVGMVFVEQKTGNATFAKYMKGYGFGEKTGIELPNEASGLIANLSSNRDVNYATAAFGQGIAVTPIQMATALASLANGGRFVAPHILDRIEYRLGIVDKTDFSQGVQILKPETSTAITKMLVTVVDKALVNGKAKMEHYSIAAKTGTAQMVNPATKEYYDDRYLHSFFGYFPAYNPRFLIFLFHTYPKGAQYASATLTDPFMSLTKFLINYYNIPPDR
ncbi:MAG: penicillin-binding protein 2 [Candidatus Paceibacterota bacterium]|jgi:cell division protein FtsI (penicillin-binding protein 3)/stage V sporulation protein D (sporulation-specific penicillin-binding protein)